MRSEDLKLSRMLVALSVYRSLLLYVFFGFVSAQLINLDQFSYTFLGIIMLNKV
jgi:hypothetical protein